MSLVFSSLFLVELAGSLVGFGLRYVSLCFLEVSPRRSDDGSVLMFALIFVVVRGWREDLRGQGV
jgi:hypothetical protein